MKLEDLKDITTPVSSASIICGTKCERKFLYRYRWGLVPKVSPFSAARIGGKLFHRLLQLGPEEVERVRTEIIEAQKELMKQIQAGEDLVGELAREAQNLTSIFNKSLAMARIFWELYPQPAHLKTIGKEIRIELEGLKHIPEGHIAKGFLDSLVQNKENGDFWIRDTKTTGRPLGLTMLGYAWSTPCRFYRYITHHWLLQNNHDPLKLRGIILDIVRTPTIKYCGKDKTFEDYVERVKAWYKEQGEGAMISKGILFTEPLLPDELVYDLKRISTLLEIEPTPAAFSRDSTGSFCKEYEKECPYYALCNSDTTLWPQIITKQYAILEKKVAEEDTEEDKP